ncbi:TetR/AcrR family transcriptional regulator [Nocardia sp. NPDC059177]|uniref:TetR/AcrR family transcriptional regulator n=1 Tax=Nocardia sp. NPDC059177 TaxID=3346759 RepID=UPI0036B5EDB1
MTTERRRRGRPPRDGAHEPLTKELIARVALDIAGDEGFPQLTMRRLATEIGVTVRALYNVVADRQEVVDLAAARMMDLLPLHAFDTADWRGSIRRVYQEARAAYRAMPRATLISLDETVTPSEVPIARVIQPERFLAFLVDLGLSIEDAVAVRGFFLVEVFGFALLVDYRYDRTDARMRQAMFHPVPSPWLAAHPEVEAPLSRRIAEAPAGTADELFEALVERAIRTIDQLRRR